MPDAYDFSDLMQAPQQRENIAASLGLSQYPMASMAAWIGLGVAEHRMTDPKRFANIFGEMGAKRWAQTSRRWVSANGMGPITFGRAASIGEAHVNSFIGRHGWSNIHEMARDMTAKHFDPSLKMSKFRFKGAAADKALYSGLERRFGKRFATRMMVGRAVGSISAAANMFFLAELGGMAGQFVGNLITNWRPTPGKPEPRRNLETGGNWVDTRIAYTQRQRSIQAIHNSMLTSRAALGNEASFMHG